MLSLSCSEMKLRSEKKVLELERSSLLHVIHHSIIPPSNLLDGKAAKGSLADGVGRDDGGYGGGGGGGGGGDDVGGGGDDVGGDGDDVDNGDGDGDGDNEKN